MNAGFNLNFVSRGAPFSPGSLQDVSGMQFVYQGAPFLVANNEPGLTRVSYAYDSRARLNSASMSTGHSVSYNLDSLGNRTSVVST